MLRVKNFVPAISVEGFKDETDMRRGEGTYNAVIKAMKILNPKNFHLVSLHVITIRMLM